jgi:large subunit ribosomal protein L23
MNILIEPVITEKMTEKSEKLHQYGFIVAMKANKVEIKKAVEKLYNVTVDSVNTIIYSGDKKNRYTRRGFIKGKTKSFKKALVTLSEGETIDFYSNI